MVSQIPLIFFSFTGWEIASHLSADFRNPKRDFGRAMCFASILVCAVYVGSAALVHIADIKSKFNVPMFQAAAQSHLPHQIGWFLCLAYR
ncbi:amino acid permease [Mesorhizobium sp.]|uniref:amino acid permease n=1 Tax=Mesorhizobium sp. TaxID=1871066 RepID=UPI00338DDF6D